MRGGAPPAAVGVPDGRGLPPAAPGNDALVSRSRRRIGRSPAESTRGTHGSRAALLCSLLDCPGATAGNVPLPPALAARGGTLLAGWLESSRRFAAFAAANRDKIRKKLRSASAPDSARDVLAELAVAFLLLQERRVELAYEPLAARGASPDLEVRFRASLSCYAEVTRMRVGRADPGDVTPTLATRLPARICAKLRQLPPATPNVLVVVADSGRGAGGIAEPPTSTSSDPAAVPALRLAVRRLRAHAEAGDDTFFERSGLRGCKDFYRLFGRLSGGLVLEDTVLLNGIGDHVYGADVPADAHGHASENDAWENMDARHPLPRELTNLFHRLARVSPVPAS